MKTILIAICTAYSSSMLAYTDSITYYQQLGVQQLQEKKYLQAEKNLLKSLQWDSSNVTTLQSIAEANIMMKRTTVALQYHTKIIKLQPNNNVALIQLAKLNFAHFKWTEAITYGKQCIDKKIGTNMHYIVAKSYYQLEDYRNCSPYLKVAATDEPTNADIPYTMANIWYNTNNPKQAISMYEIALKLDTTKVNWYLELADLYNDDAQYPKAVHCYEQALLKGAPNDLNLQTTVGLAYINAGEYKRGTDVLQKVILKKPMDKGLYDQMAFAFYEKKKYMDAAMWWDAIMQLDKNDAKTMYMIGMAFQKDGQEDKGKKICDHAILMDPALQSLRKEQQMPGGQGL